MLVFFVFYRNLYVGLLVDLMVMLSNNLVSFLILTHFFIFSFQTWFLMCYLIIFKFLKIFILRMVYMGFFYLNLKPLKQFESKYYLSIRLTKTHVLPAAFLMIIVYYSTQEDLASRNNTFMIQFLVVEVYVF